MTQSEREGDFKQPERVFEQGAHPAGALQSKNVRIHDRRTSVRLEPEMWRALNEVAQLENCSIHDLCGAVHDLKDKGASFTAALRVFLMEYYRAATKVSPQVSQVQKTLQVRLQNGDGKAVNGVGSTMP